MVVDSAPGGIRTWGCKARKNTSSGQNEEGANRARGTRRGRPVPLLARLFPPVGTLVSETFGHLHNLAMVDTLSPL